MTTILSRITEYVEFPRIYCTVRCLFRPGFFYTVQKVRPELDLWNDTYFLETDSCLFVASLGLRLDS